MTDYELRRIAQIYGATEQDVRDAERRAFAEPMVPIAEIIARVVERALTQAESD